MTGFRPTIPASVPAAAAGSQTGVTDVGATIAADTNALNNNPDARAAAGAAAAPADGTAPAPNTGVTAQQQPAQAPSAITRTGVDLNTADEAQIAKLPGINKLTAKRIVMSRPFLSVNDLIRVGVSKKTIDKLKPAAPSNGGSNSKSPTK
jgi:DNA uptake protein ComE-like DNA-binding protein